MKFYISSISKIVKFIHSISERKLEQIAEETKFIKRKRVLEPFSFGAASLKEVTLAKIIDYCKDIDPNFNMSKQALDNRLENGAVFLKKTLDYLFDKYIRSEHNNIKMLEYFKDIKIFDSTIIEFTDKSKSTQIGLIFKYRENYVSLKNTKNAGKNYVEMYSVWQAHFNVVSL